MIIQRIKARKHNITLILREVPRKVGSLEELTTKPKNLCYSFASLNEVRISHIILYYLFISYELLKFTWLRFAHHLHPSVIVCVKMKDTRKLRPTMKAAASKPTETPPSTEDPVVNPFASAASPANRPEADGGRQRTRRSKLMNIFSSRKYSSVKKCELTGCILIYKRLMKRRYLLSECASLAACD